MTGALDLCEIAVEMLRAELPVRVRTDSGKESLEPTSLIDLNAHMSRAVNLVCKIADAAENTISALRKPIRESRP